MRTVPLLAGALLALALASPALAQQGAVVSPREMDAALRARVLAEDEDRAALRHAFTHPEVEAAARRAGALDALEEARERVAELDGERLSRAAAGARALEAQLAGGQTINISTTTLIIVLLLVIIVILLVD